MYGSVIRSCSLPTLLFYFVALFGSIAVPYVTVSQPASAIRSLYLNGYNKAPFVRICGGTGWGVVDGKRSREKQKEQETLEQQTAGIHCPCRPDYQQQLQSLSEPAKRYAQFASQIMPSAQVVLHLWMWVLLLLSVPTMPNGGTEAILQHSRRPTAVQKPPISSSAVDAVVAMISTLTPSSLLIRTKNNGPSVGWERQ